MEDYPETVRALSQSTVDALKAKGIISERSSRQHIYLSLAAAVTIVVAYFLYNLTSADVVIIGFIIVLILLVRVAYYIVSCLFRFAIALLLLITALTILFSLFLLIALLN